MPKTDASNPNLKLTEEVKTKFPAIVELILASESMDDDERNYWFGVLPIMTKSQISELKDILVTEKEKLAAIDAKYAKMGGNAKPPPEPELSPEELAEAQAEREAARQKRRAKEREEQLLAEQKAEAMLEELEQI
jgi:hypothetical protein